MSDALLSASQISISGLDAQAQRLRIISENIANANSTSSKKGVDPYRRKIISFKNVLDGSSGDMAVKIAGISVDKSPFILKYEPGNPAADTRGYVKYPNVNPVIEMADMREANRSYEANLQVLRQSRELITQTLGLLK